MTPRGHGELLDLLSRRDVLTRASKLAVGLAVLPPLPPLPGPPTPANPLPNPTSDLTDATLQAFADTILPGRPAQRTDLGNPIHPLAIAGVDSRPGAVEADALAVFHHPEIGFDSLAPGFLAALESNSLPHGADFLHLDFAGRVQVCLAGLDFQNPSRVVWEAAAAVPFTAFCAAALIRDATATQASGYRVMGLPGPAPRGYRDYSYRRRLSRERTKTGSLP
jgi:hypothetical protein